MRYTLLALLALAALPAQAATTDGSFAVDGVGRASCADFTNAVEARDDMLVNGFGSWTSGFLSATNALRAGTFDVTPWQSEGLVMSQMQSYCTQNPDVAYVIAVGRLVQALLPNQLTEQAEERPLGDQGTRLYEPVIEGIRTALAESGYTVEDGDAGLTAALETFQSDNDLEPTGEPDQRTLAELFLR